MTAAVRYIPLLLSWAGIVCALGRGFPLGSGPLAGTCAAAFLAGTLVPLLGVALVIAVIKGVVATAFTLFWPVAMAALYGTTGTGAPGERRSRFLHSRTAGIVAALLSGLLAGAASVCQIFPLGGAVQPVSLAVVALAGIAVALLAARCERYIPAGFTLRGGALLALTLAFILLITSSSPRLDLFSPLVMKVMKFIHDFVHQFFESMLIPDHLFFRPSVWDFIGFFFGSGVGLWGGLIIWFAPLAAVTAAIRLERLPSVAHIRQGARRRRLLAGHIRQRRQRLAAPLLTAVVLAASVYQSRFPAVEYWDPAPIAVTATPAGEILIPARGEADLTDGRLHKFMYRQGGREARFMVLASPAGGYTVTLDACAICKPDGYGQGEGAVVCYYCKTLIPLDTVGRPGGCNPVPVPARNVTDGVRIDAATLLNLWIKTVQATAGRTGEGR